MRENHAHDNNFILKINRLDGVSYSCTRTTTPGIALGNLTIPKLKYDFPFPTGKFSWVPFTCSFLVDEDFRNWLEIFEWVKIIRNAEAPMKEVSDFSLVIPNNHGYDGISFRYTNAFPIDISPIDMSSTVSSPSPLECSLTLVYTDVEVEKS